MPVTSADLTVRGEPVERVFGNFNDRRYVVNRRYQRKLIWTLEEKREFIDSIIQGFPVPIILLAESARRDDNSLEIIDGMQRLDAIVSFIGNKYSVHDKYFDLNTIAVTKALLDSEAILQRVPVMSRELCVGVASYLLPLSIYEFADERAVDTVFRRINSGGRQLSRQEIRSAGSANHFATVVRRISAKVRGDDSYSDVLRLNEMQSISITNKELDYGIDVDSLLWVHDGILSRENVRQSRDEELVADIVAYMVSDEPISSRTELLDDYYGIGNERASAERFEAIDAAVQKRSPELVISDFQRTLDQMRLTLSASGSTFVQLITEVNAPAPRYFQVVFLAFYQLLIRKHLEVKDRGSLIEALRGSGNHINIQEGGRWGADSRQKAIDSAVGMIQKAFGPSSVTDPAQVHWITQLQNLLSQSYTEQSAYDFKQGFLELDGQHSFDEESFAKTLKTCVAIGNIGRGKKGYVLVGVAENDATANRIEKIYATSPRTYDRFRISGVEHEAKALGKNLDQFFQMVVDKVRQSQISEPLRSYVTSNIKSVRYFDKTVYVFEAIGQEQPSLYKDKYYGRAGAQVVEVLPASFPHLFRRFNG